MYQFLGVRGLVKQRLKRNRALVFTNKGFQKLQSKIRSHEREKSGAKLTLEELSEITGLAYSTVCKVLKRKKGVDKRTLTKFFFAFDLDLGSDDYTPLLSIPEQSCKCNATWANLSNMFEASRFCGREEELATIKKWLVEDNCRLVTVYGMGGIGKTTLSIKLVKEIEGKFDYVFWISLEENPPLEDILANSNNFLINKHNSVTKPSGNTKRNLADLFNHLRANRCLIVFDQVEMIMQIKAYSGCYEENRQNYGQLIRCMAEVSHQSSFLLISRELPKEVSIFDGYSLPIKSLKLKTLPQKECLNLLIKDKVLDTNPLKKQLVEIYDGNLIALFNASRHIRKNYAGSIQSFLHKGQPFSEDILAFMEDHYQRLSLLEKAICRELVIYTKPILISDLLMQLQNKLSISISFSEISMSLSSLSNRDLITIKKDFIYLKFLLFEYLSQKYLVVKLAKYDAPVNQITSEPKYQSLM